MKSRILEIENKNGIEFIPQVRYYFWWMCVDVNHNLSLRYVNAHVYCRTLAGAKNILDYYLETVEKRKKVKYHYDF